MSEKPILITPAHFLGLDELYTNFFKCPICKTKKPGKWDVFLPGLWRCSENVAHRC